MTDNDKAPQHVEGPANVSGVAPMLPLVTDGAPGPEWCADWRATAEEAVLRLAASGRPFCTDDVRDLGVPEPGQPNRWGALLVALHKGGHIVPLSTVTARRRARHAGLNRLWVGAEFARGSGL